MNAGRAIDRFQYILRLFKKNKALNHAAHLGAFRKLGAKEFIRCALLNPKILSYAFSELRAVDLEGHEIGLHGGRNHDTWASGAHSWTVKRTRAEIEWGAHQLSRLGVSPTAFASPCAIMPPYLDEVLAALGFRYFADDLYPCTQSKTTTTVIPNLPTRLCGEGGTAYIEHQVALGHKIQQIESNFVKDLESRKIAVLYDHPYFAGCEAIEITRRLILAAKNQGFKVKKLVDLSFSEVE